MARLVLHIDRRVSYSLGNETCPEDLGNSIAWPGNAAGRAATVMTVLQYQSGLPI